MSFCFTTYQRKAQAEGRLKALLDRPILVKLAACSGYRRSSHERSCGYPASGPVSTGMGDRLWAGIPSRYVTSQLGQLSLASIRGR